jgi:nucleoside-diphosphate-sugar epimerase
VGLRYFNVYGPRQDPNGPYAAVIPRFFSSCRTHNAPVIFGDGEQSRDFTYVADVVRANLLAMLSNTGSGRAYNVGAGQRTTIRELAEAIIKATSADVKPQLEAARAGDVMHSLADTSAIQQAFGWVAQTSIAEGLKHCAKFY